MSGFELHLRSYIIVTIKIKRCSATFYSLSAPDQVFVRKVYNFTEENPRTPLRVFQKIIWIIIARRNKRKHTFNTRPFKRQTFLLQLLKWCSLTKQDNELEYTHRYLNDSNRFSKKKKKDKIMLKENQKM